MLFNSIEFIIFLPLFFGLYWSLNKKSNKAQNILLLIGSYVFYGWWDYRFLGLLFLSTVVDFYASRTIYRSDKRSVKRGAMISSLVFNIGILFFFKYYNFFIDSFLELFGGDLSQSSIYLVNVILPVGISFYTFQTLSYTLDVYHEKLKPSNDFIDLAVYVSFFPQLVAGPIERATHFLPQVQNKRTFNFQVAKDGIQLILIGFFKKLVIADAFATAIDDVFINHDNVGYLSLIIGAVMFAFQIYCDFSGYSDIARGLAKILGFELMLNFRFPYFSQSIAEFWRRWHISLSTWFRDYLYIPLGGSRVSFWKAIRNVFIIFLVSGFWHGANWTFIFWGLIHALLFVPSFVAKKLNFNFMEPTSRFLSNSLAVLRTLYVFILATIAWVFFRAENISDALTYLKRIFTLQNGRMYFSVDNIGLASFSNLVIASGMLGLLLFYEFQSERGKVHKSTIFSNSVILLMILLFGQFLDEGMFIYFQF